MSTTVWDAAMAAITARIRSQITDVTLDLDRRSPVAAGDCPRLVLTLGQIGEDLTMSPQEAFHAITLDLAGYVTGTTDTECRIALSTLLARCVAALNGWQSGVIFDVTAAPDRRITLYGAEDSAKAMGEFAQGFVVQAVTPANSPYTD